MLIGTFFFAHGWGLLVARLHCGDLALPVTCCATLGKLSNHSVLQFLLELL